MFTRLIAFVAALHLALVQIAAAGGMGYPGSGAVTPTTEISVFGQDFTVVQTETLGTTEEHSFYVDGKGWVEASDLAVGDQVVRHDAGDGLAGFLTVKAVTLEAERQDTYNFEVAETHTYFVGLLAALVHNNCSPTDLLNNGGRHLDPDTIIGAYGNKFVRNGDGTYTNVGPASQAEIAASGVTVRPNPAPADWPEVNGALKDASNAADAALAGKGKINYGIGSFDYAQTMAMGEAWVGPGYRVTSNGFLVSADGLRQFRPPSYKPQLGKIQANFEQRLPGSTKWGSNGHVDVVP